MSTLKFDTYTPPERSDDLHAFLDRVLPDIRTASDMLALVTWLRDSVEHDYEDAVRSLKDLKSKSVFWSIPRYMQQMFLPGVGDDPKFDFGVATGALLHGTLPRPFGDDKKSVGRYLDMGLTETNWFDYASQMLTELDARISKVRDFQSFAGLCRFLEDLETVHGVDLSTEVPWGAILKEFSKLAQRDVNDGVVVAPLADDERWRWFGGKLAKAAEIISNRFIEHIRLYFAERQKQ